MRRRSRTRNSSAAVNGTAAGGGYELALAVRRDHARRRRLLRRVAARGAAARRAARHGRPHARGRQAQGPPRPRRRVLHHRGRHQGPPRRRVGPRRRDRAALARRGEDRRPRRRFRARSPAPEGLEADRADAASARDRARPPALFARSRSRSIARPGHDGDRHGPDAPPPAGVDGLVAEGAESWMLRAAPRARRRHPASALQRARDRGHPAQDARRPGARRGARPRSSTRSRTIGSRARCAISGSAC